MQGTTLKLNKYNILLAVIFIGAILLRIELALYNREANDHHMPVIRYIMRNDTLPEKSDCWECFQPKLFHYMIAKILSYLRLEEGQDNDAQKVLAQIINVFAGTVTLFIAWKFIHSLAKIRDDVKLLGFALLAFNPTFIGINSQVTNDTFLIMFCVLSVYFAYLFIRRQAIGPFLLVIVFSLLSVLTKTNGWVTVTAITISLLVRAFLPKFESPWKLAFAAAYPIIVLSLAILSPLSQYMENYLSYGSPILLNIDRKPPPLFFKQTYVPFAGILSIQDGFLTFKLKDLLENPVTSMLDETSDTSHRTSLWTRLYGSANSVHFENYPPTWRNLGQFPFFIYRGIYLLALLPLTAVLFGMFREIGVTIKSILTKDAILLEDVSYGLFALLSAGYILFIMLYAFQYRMCTVIKATFIYPGFFAYMLFYLRTLNTVFSSPRIKNWHRTAITALTTALLVLYIVDVSILIVQLLPNQSGWDIVADRLFRAWR
jgi:hypothetical protein